MNALFDALRNRRSIPARQLTEPAPTASELNELLSCAITAPDHAAMHPWRFIVIRGDARARLGEIFADVLRSENPDASAEKLKVVGEKPLRAPLIVAVVATITDPHPKTPVIEQVLSAGAAAHQLQLAATAKGFGSVWLTGPNAYHPTVKAALNVAEKDQIVGFIYLGTPQGEAPPKRKLPVLENLVSEWSGG